VRREPPDTALLARAFMGLAEHLQRQEGNEAEGSTREEAPGE
jgi:hypothetical protein